MRNSKQKEERKIAEYLRWSENNEDVKNTTEWYSHSP